MSQVYYKIQLVLATCYKDRLVIQALIFCCVRFLGHVAANTTFNNIFSMQSILFS